jgi:SHOCT-like domain
VNLEPVRVGSVGGDVRARRLRAGLTLEHGGGNGRLTEVSGPVEVAFGGDLVGRAIGSPLSAQVGGDATLDLELGADAGADIMAGGDIICRLGESPSAEVSIHAGGSRQIRLPAKLAGDGTERWILGAGGPAIDLKAGGDVWLGGQGVTPDVSELEDVGARVAASVGKTLAEVEAGLSAVGAMMETIPEAEISTKVQRVVERAMRRRMRHHKGYRVVFPEAARQAGAPSPASEEEKLKILKMVEDGKLSVGDAEKLFKALEN